MVERAPKGAWDIIRSVRRLVDSSSVEKTSDLLDVTPSTIYKILRISREGLPARNLWKRDATVERWDAQLNRAKNEILRGQRLEPPEMGDKSAANMLQAISPDEDWNYQKITAMRQQHGIPRGQPPVRGPDRPAPAAGPPEEDREPTREEFLANPDIHHYRDRETDVRFTEAGYTWPGRDFIETNRATLLNYSDAVRYATEGGNQDKLIIEIRVDEYGDEYYVVHLDYERATPR